MVLSSRPPAMPPHPHSGCQAKYNSPEAEKYKVDELVSVETLLLGKTTYEGFAAYWLGQTGAGLADPQKILKRFASLSFPVRFRSGDIKLAAALACTPGRPVVVAKLAGTG